jgi:hypothetical protein
MKTITLNVCQGVGDIFWVYQKFAPHVDKIDFRITHVHNGDTATQNRANDFLRLWPKTGEISSWLVPGEEYNWIASQYHPMDRIFEKFNKGYTGPFDYACNRPLEQGTRIEDIDKDFQIEETVEMQSTPCPLVFNPGEYVCLYVSGATKKADVIKKVGVWTIAQWVDFVSKFYKKYKLKSPLMIIGASYDKDVALNIEAALKKVGYNVHTYIDSWAANVLYIIKNSICFIGYQSGLNILADNMDVKQVMMYFPVIRPMLYAWCKNKNRDNHTFNADVFDSPVDQVLANLKLKL